MMTEGEPARGRRLKNLGSSGLAVVLDHEESGSSVVTATTCMLDDNPSGLERTLAHVLDVSSSGADSVVTSDNKIDSAAFQHLLLSRLNGLQGADLNCDADRDGVFIDESPLGPGVVMMDPDSSSGLIKFDKACLMLESQLSFNSARANTCVWSGQWMFEATLGTGGIQQIGWATLSCPFTQQKGVGDAFDSYAYDGKRVRKWNFEWQPYGQQWVAGDVIGCCIDLDAGQISFYRNGISLGIAFEKVRQLEPKKGYFPALSMENNQRCELNFGGRPFKYPLSGFSAIQAPPTVHIDREGGSGFVSATVRAKYLFGCLQRLVQLGSREVAAAMAPVERLKRYTPLNEDESYMVGSMIMELLQPLLCTVVGSDSLEDGDSRARAEYIIWGALVPFLMDTLRLEAPHDAPSVDQALEFVLPCLDSVGAEIVLDALAYGCRTSPFTLTDYPYTGSYAYLALACHLLEREDFMNLWWRSSNFEACLEGLLTRKGPNKHDLEALMPTVWWHGSREDLCSESKMRHAASALAKAIAKVEELHWELCRTLLHFIPPNIGAVTASSSQVPGVLFRKFLRRLMLKNSGAHRNVPPPGLSDNSVLVTAYYVLLRFLSEGLEGNKNSDTGEAGKEQQDTCAGFLHRVGKRTFPVSIFLKENSYSYDFARVGGTFSHLTKIAPVAGDDFADVEWEESSMDDGCSVVRHGGKSKPACCLDLTDNSISNDLKSIPEKAGVSAHSGSISERSNNMSNDCPGRSCNGIDEDKPSSSGRVDSTLRRRSSHYHKSERVGFKAIKDLSEAIREEELLDMLVLLYHLGLASNFKQATYDMQLQMQLISQLEDIDRQIRTDKVSSEFLKKLKEDRASCREKLIECVRRCTWYRVSLFSRWKQRGMYATCMWVVQLLLVLSKKDQIFGYIPEFYMETLVDSFHALRRSDPPFVTPASALLQQGLSPLVTFLVTHFSDPRIANPDIRDVLVQSISVLVQYKEHVVAFEKCKAARESMVAALLTAFDNRFWIPVSNILLRLCKGAGFGASKCYPHGESFSSYFQQLLKEKCILDEKLFASFLNRLFNTLNWTITEFSVVIKEMEELTERGCQVTDLQQRKCTIMFELSCNLERILEFFTQELSHAFLLGAEMNLVRLCELIIFVLNHTTSSSDAQIFDSALRHGASLDKCNRSMILAPIVGIVLNLSAATASPNHGLVYDIAHVIANVDYSPLVISNFQYLLDYNWAASFKGDPSVRRLPELKSFVKRLKIEIEIARKAAREEEIFQSGAEADGDETADTDTAGDEKGEICSICYACEVDTIFVPCKHQSCLRCITRHLLNNQRCFFCNATISELCSMSDVVPAKGEFTASNAAVTDGGVLAKNESP
ncbi:unnamed protein product [Calypogeia fissa]